MANIVAPSSPFAPYYIGKGLRGNNGNTVQIFGQSLPNDGVLGTNNLTIPMSIVNPTTYFDMTGHFANTEIPVVLYVSPNRIYSSVNYTITWYRERDTTVAFKYNYTLAGPPSGQSLNPGASVFAWIGWLHENNPGVPTFPMYREIQENGNYYAIISATGGESFTSPRINFVVVNIPPYVALENPTTNGFTWTVKLSNYFDTSNYIRAGICTGVVNDGQSTPPEGIISSLTSTMSSNISTIVKSVASGLNSGTQYGVYGFAQAANGLYYRAGWAFISTLGNPRPQNWSWYTPKTSGESFNITSVEWNQFTAAINRFRAYQDLLTLGFTSAPYGTEKKFYAFMFNQALVAIKGGTLDGTYYPPLNGMSSTYYTQLPSLRSEGDTIYAHYFNNLRDAMNSVS